MRTQPTTSRRERGDDATVAVAVALAAVPVAVAAAEPEARRNDLRASRREGRQRRVPRATTSPLGSGSPSHGSRLISSVAPTAVPTEAGTATS